MLDETAKFLYLTLHLKVSRASFSTVLELFNSQNPFLSSLVELCIYLFPPFSVLHLQQVFQPFLPFYYPPNLYFFKSVK